MNKFMTSRGRFQGAPHELKELLCEAHRLSEQAALIYEKLDPSSKPNKNRTPVINLHPILPSSPSFSFFPPSFSACSSGELQLPGGVACTPPSGSRHFSQLPTNLFIFLERCLQPPAQRRPVLRGHRQRRLLAGEEEARRVGGKGHVHHVEIFVEVLGA